MSDKNNQIQLPSRESISSFQITNLLNTFTILGNFLNHSIAIDSENTTGGPRDGGVRAAVETTLINVCDRLDQVMAEKGRFDLATQNNLETQLSEGFKQNIRMLSAQAEAYEEIVSPHHRLKPTLVKIGPGSWLAFCGDATNLDNALVGMGDCPARAIDAFDALFKGQVPAHLTEFLKAREKSINQDLGTPPLEWSNFKPKSNEKNTLDDSRNNPIENPPSKRRKPRRDSKTDGTQPEIGGNGDSPE